jgi:hypothetical protein
LFSNNSPTVSWIHWMACRLSLIAEQLIRVLALRLNLQCVCPITTLHIVGDQNSMTDIPSRSFGSKQKWHFTNNEMLLTFFNSTSQLPHQNSWSVCQPTATIATRVTSFLRMQPFPLEDWRRLPTVTKNIGITGKPMQALWEWTLIFRTPPSKNESDCYQDSLQESARATIEMAEKSKIAQSVARSQLLAR